MVHVLVLLILQSWMCIESLTNYTAMQTAHYECFDALYFLILALFILFALSSYRLHHFDTNITRIYGVSLSITVMP
jgi:hypothetical protein